MSNRTPAVLLVESDDRIADAITQLLVSHGYSILRAQPIAQPAVGGASLDIQVDRPRRIVSHGGVRIDLAPREYELLLCLLDHEGRIVSRETLFETVWKYADHQRSANVIDVHIARLRRKLEAQGVGTRLIHTVRGAGYVLNRLR